MRAHAVVIRQPGKQDYMQLRVYHSVSLLRCMGKVVEKLVTELLAEETERRGQLTDGQYGSRNSRSAVDSSAIMVDRVHAACSEGHIAGVLLTDINASFPRVGRGRLMHTIRGKGMDGDLIRWTASFVTDRMVEMVIECNVMERHLGEARIP